jgi:hypothetical protein
MTIKSHGLFPPIHNLTTRERARALGHHILDLHCTGLASRHQGS